MDVTKLYYQEIDEKGQVNFAWRGELIETIDEVKKARDYETMRSILRSLSGYTIIEATAILRKCEVALQQAVFDDEIK
mgnify:CR=1 FL=1